MPRQRVIKYRPIKYLSKQEEAILLRKGRTKEQIKNVKTVIIEGNKELKKQINQRLPYNKKNNPIEINKEKRIILDPNKND